MDQHTQQKQIQKQVEQIIQSPLFKRSKILNRFLNYIVTETLNGNKAYLKEYTIGVNVLDRGFNFDPQIDGVVRIHANRLRKLLTKYYQDFGPDDPVKISMPTGRYIPTIELVENNQKVELGIFSDKDFVPRQVIALVPVNSDPGTFSSTNICSILHKELNSELSWFPEIDIISDFPAEIPTTDQKAMSDFFAKSKVDYCVYLNCHIENDKAKIKVELTGAPNGPTIWTEVSEFSEIEAKPEKSLSLIPKVISVLCGFLGIIYRNKQNEQLQQDYDNLGAIFWHNQYHTDYSQEDIMHALNALDMGLKKNPKNSLLMAYLAELYLNFNLMDIQQGVDFLSKTIALGKRAIALDDTNQHAYGVLAAASVHKKNMEDFTYCYKKCLSINPHSPMYRGVLGAINVMAGEYQHGFELMSQTMKQIAYYPFEINVGFSLYYIYKNDYKKALVWAEGLKKANLIWDPILRTVCLAYLNRLEEADKSKDEIFAISPNFSERAKIIVNIPLVDIDLQKSLIEGLILSGIDIKK